MRLEYTREEELTAVAHAPPADRHGQDRRAGRPVHRHRDARAREHRRLRHPRAHRDERDGKPGPVPLPRPNLRYEARAVYTNLAVAGAFRGYGCPQGFFALESHVDEVAKALGEDPLEFRRRNHVREGDDLPIARALGEGREGQAQTVRSCGLPRAIEAGRGGDRLGPAARRAAAPDGLRRGIGMAITMQGSGIAGVDMGAASIKMNEDGSFNLLVGATDIGTGSDTVLCQIAAEVARGADREHRPVLVGHRPHAVRPGRLRLVDDLRLRRGRPEGRARGPRTRFDRWPRGSSASSRRR